MCYYFSQTKDKTSVQQKFKAKLKTPELFTTSEQFNAFDYPKTPVIADSSREVIEMAEWGLIPPNAAETWNRNFTLNARIETLNEKPAFRESAANRCLVITDGFYEWQHNGKQKIKFKIGFGDELFALAGIYSLIGNQIYYAIVTTAAQGIMKEIHNTQFRMPYALKTDEAFNNWLNAKETQPDFDFTAVTKDDIQLSLF